MPRRMGRPGLVGTMARTAVIAGTASATVGAVNNRAQKKAMAQQQEVADAQQMQDMQAQMDQMQAQMGAPQAPAPAAPAPAAAPAAAGGSDDIAAQLTQLKGLVDQGVLTQEEFDAKKKQLLGI
jgi:Short C-terminal domain